MTLEEIERHNLEHFMKRGPALSSAYIIHVVARDRRRKMVLLGGLGGCGCGRMWTGEHPDAETPLFTEAPDMDYDKNQDQFEENSKRERDWNQKRLEMVN